MTGILTVPIAISASKHYYSRKAIEALPRAIALSPDQLGAHIMGEKPTAELGNLKARQLAEEWSAWTETEFVYTGEQKGSVFIFAAPDSTRYHLGKNAGNRFLADFLADLRHISAKFGKMFSSHVF